MQIQFDYRFDTNGFFNDPSRRDALEAAADIWESLLLDDFDTVPVGIEFSVTNPQTGVQENIILDQTIDDLLIFVGAQSPPFGDSSPGEGNVLARAGFDGADAEGDIFNVRIDDNFRNTGSVTNFEPWVGAISFESTVDWDFSLTNPDPAKQDFISVTLHEIGHILGIGTAAIFEEIGANGFDGFNALNVNNGQPIPLTSDLGHVQEGFNNDTVLFDPIYGQVRTPSDVDLALLADIGYEIAGFTAQGSTPSIATDTGETIFGTIVDDVIDGLGGDDQLQGNSGNDILGGGEGGDLIFGQEGDDFLFGGIGQDQLLGGLGNDFLFGNAENDTLFGDEDDDFLRGGSGEDELQGGAGNDFLNGNTENDRLLGEGGQDYFIVDLNNGSDTINDFTVGEDRVTITDRYGLADGADVLNAITVSTELIVNGEPRLGSLISFDSNNEILVSHDQPLTPESFVISSNVDQRLELTPNGVAFQFDQPLNLDVLNLYQGQNSASALADFTLVGDTVGTVSGSLVWDDTTNRLTFVKTGKPLPADNYTLTLASRDDGFIFDNGELLDGNGDGTPGGNFISNFSIPATESRILSLADFTRAPGQAVNVPATETGIPLNISDATDVQSLDLTLTYNPDLLTMTGVSLDANLPASWQVLASDFSTPGQAIVNLGGTDPLASGQTNLAYLEATVTDTATSGDSGLLKFESAQVNNGAISVFGDTAVQQVALFGDSTGNSDYSGLDASLIARVAVGLDTGFDAFPRTDPILIGDTTGNGELSGLDASFVARAAVGLPQAEIPS